MAMIFRTEFLDGFDLLYKRTEAVIKSSEEMATFFKKLSSVESEYAKELLKLCKSSEKRIFKSTKDEKSTLREGWESMIIVLERISNKHNEFSNYLGTDLNNQIQKHIKESDTYRKKLVGEGQRLTKTYKDSCKALSESKQKYTSASKDAEGAQNEYNKAKQNPQIKEKQLKKLNDNVLKAADKANMADQEYQKQLAATNAKQNNFYTQEMPNLLDEFQRFEEDRITCVKNSMSAFTDKFNEFPPFLENSVQTVKTAVHAIDKDEDVKTFATANRTGAGVPADFKYEPYTYGGEVPKGSGELRPAAKPPSIAPAAPTKEYGLSEEDESLSAEEKIKKLQDQLDDVKKAIQSDVKARKGIENLVRFYANDPTAQNKVKGELEECKKKIVTLKNSKKRVLTQLEELTGSGAGDDDEDDAGGEPQGAESGQDANQGVIKARALYDYDAANDTELSFKEGDVLLVTERDESGWWFCEVDGRSGFVPNTYVEEIQE